MCKQNNDKNEGRMKNWQHWKTKNIGNENCFLSRPAHPQKPRLCDILENAS